LDLNASDLLPNGEMAMTNIETFFRTVQARAWGAGAAAVLLLAGASGAVAQTGIEVPAQVFDHGPTRAKPVVKLQPDASGWARAQSDGRSFGANVPLGAGQRLPLTVHFLSAEAQCHDADVTRTAEEQDEDFIHDAKDRGDDLGREGD
jgi:hypothetical protein